MKRFGNILRFALCVSVLAIPLGVPTRSRAVDPGPPSGLNVTVTNTTSNPVLTQNVGGGAATQVGQPASNLLGLLCNSKGCFPIARNGTASGSKFSVPAGQALVITDVQWVFETTRTQGSYDFTFLQINSKDVAVFSAPIDPSSISAGQAHLANAAVITPGNTVSLNWPNAELPPAGEEPFGFIQGYLVPNQ